MLTANLKQVGFGFFVHAFFLLASGRGQFSGGTTTHHMALGIPVPP
jgi:hypothetical protein